jgi:uncharacterized SAM-dependent methyltransferase
MGIKTKSPNFSSNKQGINDLIFKELLKRGYALEGNTRVWNIADSKLWYLTPEQAQAYLNLENSGEYVKATNQRLGEDLMVDNAKEILERLGKDPVNVVDLGCGDGKKAAKLIKAFEGKLKMRYFPIDISSFMVQQAIETFSKLNLTEEIVQFQWNISDFENLENVAPLLIKGEFKRNLFLLLGNTLGNFEIHELLYEIRSAMKDGDLLLVDTAVADEKVQERAQLQSKNQLVDKFLIQIPLQLGLTRDDLEYGARFKNSRIEFYYTIKNNKTINFQDKTLVFNKGDQIVVALAYKHDKDLLRSYFNMYFTEVLMKLSKDKAQAFILCKK